MAASPVPKSFDPKGKRRLSVLLGPEHFQHMAADALAKLRVELHRRHIISSDFMRSADVKNRGDELSVGELDIGLKAVGIELEQAQLQALFSRMDTDSDDRISFQELEQCLKLEPTRLITEKPSVVWTRRARARSKARQKMATANAEDQLRMLQFATGAPRHMHDPAPDDTFLYVL